MSAAQEMREKRQKRWKSGPAEKNGMTAVRPAFVIVYYKSKP